ncbi:hypothetical protein E3N88_31823 [Mikania micrantha]|uniref:Uncharacterized protein n=1 Tax=Mikania micrantha TaxID=192012 RepID=A0A5N6M6P8_9ASTR|nr:hypothetical protein E3N88_31823 [Mikania micrantha]
MIVNHDYNWVWLLPYLLRDKHGCSSTCYWDDSTREMVNVGENRARNGVTDCLESRNEENFQSMELLDSSRYATERLRILRGTRWTKISEILRISSRYAKPFWAPCRGTRRVRRWKKLITSSTFHSEDYFF